jgi:uncharacterized protein YukE
MADLLLNREIFSQGSLELRESRNNLSDLRNSLNSAFEQLRSDWDSEAGKQFFERFDNDLVKNIDDYLLVFEHMRNNLRAASLKYGEVFSAADSVAGTQY